MKNFLAVAKPFTADKQAAASTSELFRNFAQKNQAHFIQPEYNSGLQNWKQDKAINSQQSDEQFESLLDKLKTGGADIPNLSPSYPQQQQKLDLLIDESSPVIQLHNTYIITSSGRGFIIIHQQMAHERILYERLSQSTDGKSVATQKSLFPATLHLSAADSVLLADLMADLNQLGYLIEPFGKEAFVIQGTPADIQAGNEKQVIENLLEQFKHFSAELKFSKREKLIRSFSWQQAIKAGTSLAEKEMRSLITDLFNCTQPNVTAAGHPTFIEFRKDYLDHLFKR